MLIKYNSWTFGHNFMSARFDICEKTFNEQNCFAYLSIFKIEIMKIFFAVKRRMYLFIDKLGFHVWVLFL